MPKLKPNGPLTWRAVLRFPKPYHTGRSKPVLAAARVRGCQLLNNVRARPGKWTSSSDWDLVKALLGPDSEASDDALFAAAQLLPNAAQPEEVVAWACAAGTHWLFECITWSTIGVDIPNRHFWSRLNTLLHPLVHGHAVPPISRVPALDTIDWRRRARAWEPRLPPPADSEADLLRKLRFRA